jgi:hypothetical protein
MAWSGFGLARIQNMNGSSANNTLERTVKHRGCTALAMDCVLAVANEGL